LQRLHELRLVDDSTFAEQYVSSRKRARGRLVLRRELQRKGVAEELVERELEALSPEQQARAATELLQKNAWRYRPQSDQTQAGQEASEAASHARREQLLKARSKAFAFLARRGYTAEAAQQALQRTGWFEDHDD
ncbi:MAG: regulatory protein RecX, partial [Trueperaceae bacterium]